MVASLIKTMHLEGESQAQNIEAKPEIILNIGGEQGSGTSATGEKVGRNDPCPCGSGKKYKKCHGINE